MYVRSFLRRRRAEIISLTVIALVCALVISVVMIFFGDGVWGSVTDWENQHFAIPEYFRTRFYATGDLLPDLAPQLGAGQNIYTLAYYGLMNPIYLPAYLMPHVSMAVYIQICGIAVVFASAVMMYFLARRFFDGWIPLFCALLFVLSAPLLYHSHRHIMFISYMPFLLTAMLAVSGDDSPRSRAALMISSCCILCTSFYFSISSFAVIVIFAVFAILRRFNSIGMRRLTEYMIPRLICIFIGAVSAGFLWLPTFFTLVRGRESNASFVNVMKLLIPTVNLGHAMYSSYSLGFTAIVIAAAILLFFSQDRASRLIARVFAVLICMPVIVYIFNGTMYIDPKILIPFTPLAALMCGEFAVSLQSGRVKLLPFLAAFTAVLLLDMLLNYRELYKNLIIFSDCAVLMTAVILHIKTDKRKLFFITAVASAAVMCIAVNSTDKYVNRSTLDEIYSEDISGLVDKAVASDRSFYRFAGLTDSYSTVNMVYGSEYYSATIYSSVSDSDYRSFRVNGSGSGMSQRCNARQTQPYNEVFNVLMGCRYRISNEPAAMSGETVECSSGGKFLLRNENALPVGYACSDVIGEAEWSALDSAARAEAMLGRIVVPSETDGTFIPQGVGRLETGYTVEGDISAITPINRAYEVCSSEPFRVTAKLDEPIAGKLVFLTCRADNRVGDISKRSDISLTVNGVKNTLSAPGWKYHNGNYDFSFVLSSDGDIDKLEFEFSAGDYILSDFSVTLLDESLLRSAQLNKDAFIIDRDKMGGDTIEGSIDVTEDGWFTLSVPYDKGFEITVDGIPTQYSKTNTAFIGFPISRGEHSIIINYHAPMKTIGVLMTIMGSFAAALMLVLMHIRERKGSFAAIPVGA